MGLDDGQSRLRIKAFSRFDSLLRYSYEWMFAAIEDRQSKIKIFWVSVAQPDRASDFGSEGCGFESLQARES
jgi:hypothetical protein